MIKAKIITQKQAEKLGLKKSEKKSGFGIKAIGCVVQGKQGEESKLMETSILKENGEIELILMDPEREKQLKNRRQFSKYIQQFCKLPGGLK